MCGETFVSAVKMTPEKNHMELQNGVQWKIIFLFKGGRFSGSVLFFRGV